MGFSAEVVQAEAIAWLASHPAPEHSSVITSLPDHSELTLSSLAQWRAWFVDAARAILRWLPADGTAIFYQRDVRRDAVWVDKSQLVLAAAAAESFELVWHKIVCRTAPDLATRAARPGYSHLLCLQREARAPRRPLPDVLSDAGPGSWSRAMGLNVCQLACEHLRNETSTRWVVDPFCGRGAVLAVAAAMGFQVIGVELHARRSRSTRSMLARTCETLAAVQRGAALFDRGAYFEAHEAWEERWRISRDEPERLGLQGLIQVTAALHKLFVVGNAASAQRLLARGLQKLERVHWLPGVALAELRPALQACAASLDAGSLERAQVPRLGRGPGEPLQPIATADAEP